MEHLLNQEITEEEVFSLLLSILKKKSCTKKSGKTCGYRLSGYC
jgi:hypothetical protein